MSRRNGTSEKFGAGETGVGEMGAGEMGKIIGETGIGEMGVGETGTNLSNSLYNLSMKNNLIFELSYKLL